MQLRTQGKYDESIKLAQTWIDKNDTYIYEFYRQQALCYLRKEEYRQAYGAASSATELNNSKQRYDTLALCCLANKNQTGFDEIKKMYDRYELDFSADVIAYRDGKISLKEILTQGDFDV